MSACMSDIGVCAGTRMTFDLFVLGEHGTPLDFDGEKAIAERALTRHLS